MVKRNPIQSPTNLLPQSTPFPYADYIKARTGLLDALSGPSFYALLTGPTGMGKTCLLKEISAGLDRHRHQVLYISSSKASLTGIMRFVAMKLRITPKFSYLETVDLLSEAIQAQSSHLILWVDEADLVDPAVLQETRVLSESNLSTSQLFSIVLCGLPPLLSILDSPALFPLKRRINLRFTLSGLRRDEFEPFLAHRFGQSELGRLPAQIFDELFERTQATPALIETLIRKILKDPSNPIDPEQIHATLDVSGL